MGLVNVIVRIVHTGDIKTTNNNLTLKKYIATGDGTSQMETALVEHFTDQMELNNNLQLVIYLNERKLGNTTLTKVEKTNKDIPD